MSQQPMRILQVIGAMDRGGAETFVMNLYRNVDRAKIQFDFLVNENRECDYDAEIREMGGHIYRIPRYNLVNGIQYKKACRDFFRLHRYPVVHGHIGLPASIYLSEAGKRGSFTIAHSHSRNYPFSIEEAVFRICSHRVRNVADYFLACSREAGVDRFGGSIVSGDLFHILNNGVDTNALAFSVENRIGIRSELGISKDAPVFGHVGRLTEVKNHRFLIEVFSAINQKYPESKLLLVGRGELEAQLHEEVAKAGLEGSVLFLGVRNDVAAILSAMDVFLFPSLSEGLSCAAIEAQASGLPTLLSTGVPELTRILPFTKRLDLSKGSDAWAEEAEIMYSASRTIDRLSAKSYICKAGFDIEESAAWIQKLYLRHA